MKGAHLGCSSLIVRKYLGSHCKPRPAGAEYKLNDGWLRNVAAHSGFPYENFHEGWHDPFLIVSQHRGALPASQQLFLLILGPLDPCLGRSHKNLWDLSRNIFQIRKVFSVERLALQPHVCGALPSSFVKHNLVYFIINDFFYYYTTVGSLRKPNYTVYTV